MDLKKITPIIERLFKEALEEPRYRFGVKYKGKGPKVASGSLRDSIKAKVVKDTDNSKVIRVFGKKLDGAGIEPLNLSLGQLVNDGRGRNKKQPPIESIEQWIKDKKGFRLRDSKGKFRSKGDKKLLRSVAFVISRSIGKFGTKRSNWINVALTKVEKNKEIKELLGQQTMYDLLKILRDI